MEKNYLSYEIDKLAEENRKLRSENRNYRELLSFNQDLIFRFHTIEKYFEYVSPACETLTGYPAADFYQRPAIFDSLVEPGCLAAFKEMWDRGCRGLETNECEFELIRENGSRLWAAVRIWTVLNRLGKVVAFVGNVRDISLRKQMEERIRTLEGLIPICASCKKIHASNDGWQEIEHYLADRTRMDFTHGLCPDCRSRLFPDS